jgi:hypothetical protein
MQRSSSRVKKNGITRFHQKIITLGALSILTHSKGVFSINELDLAPPAAQLISSHAQ